MIEYIDDGKRAIFNGLVFVRDDQTGYYLNSTLHIRLHRAVYEYYYGKIPNGYHVHHVDHDKANNDPDNLIALSRSDHLKLHEDELTCEQREARVENIVSHAVPAAVAWHKSEEGRAWHLAHYEQMKDALHRRAWHVCDHCGRDFYGLANGTVRFCSNAC